MSKKRTLAEIIEPLDDMLIVRKFRMEKSAGGVLMPDKQDIRGRFVVRGEILAAGPGKLKDDGERGPMPAKNGDHIFFSNQAGLEMDDELRNIEELGLTSEEAKKILLIRSVDVICKVNK